jgi:hypothetical protein
VKEGGARFVAEIGTYKIRPGSPINYSSARQLQSWLVISHAGSVWTLSGAAFSGETTAGRRQDVALRKRERLVLLA